MSRFFVDRPIVAIVIAVLTVILGAVSLAGLPVAQYPSIKALDVDADFPRKLSIVVHERAAVAAIQSGGATVAASGDGLVLRGMRARPGGSVPYSGVESSTRGRSVSARRARSRRSPSPWPWASGWTWSSVSSK